MSNVNSTIVSGNLTADPELKMRGADGDFAIVDLRIAVNRDKKQADGSYESEASYFDATVLGNYAKLVDRKCRKGDAVTIQGRLEQQRWQNEAGENRSKVVIIVDQLDGAAMYRKDEDVKPKADGASQTSQAPLSGEQAAADDDIPF